MTKHLLKKATEWGCPSTALAREVCGSQSKSAKTGRGSRRESRNAAVVKGRPRHLRQGRRGECAPDAAERALESAVNAEATEINRSIRTV